MASASQQWVYIVITVFNEVIALPYTLGCGSPSRALEVWQVPSTSIQLYAGGKQVLAIYKHQRKERCLFIFVIRPLLKLY